MNGRYQLADAEHGQGRRQRAADAAVSELTTFAQQNPDVVEFDEKKGLVKFKSDVTFSAGSAVVKPEAKGVIDRLAGILNGPTASQYELMVAGHTDNQPVSNPATKKAGHLDNWYLSAHRAISVSQELRGQGTSGARIHVAGFADQKPVASNDIETNKARNRRVEVFILPTTVGGGSPAPSAPAAPITVAPKAPGKQGINKDPGGTTVEVDKKPYLSK
jgi:chemotaxis protein MotB